MSYWISYCPCNVGTGLRISAKLRLPILSTRSDFKENCKNLGLQIRGASGVDSIPTDGIVELSNANRVGNTENELASLFTSGILKIMKWEEDLEQTIDKKSF